MRGAAKGCRADLPQLVVHQPQVVQRQRAARDAWHAEQLGRQRQPQRDEARGGLGGGAARLPGDARRGSPSRRRRGQVPLGSVPPERRLPQPHQLEGLRLAAWGGRLGTCGCRLAAWGGRLGAWGGSLGARGGSLRCTGCTGCTGWCGGGARGGVASVRPLPADASTSRGPRKGGRRARATAAARRASACCRTGPPAARRPAPG